MESINESISFYNLIEKHKNELNKGCGKLCLSPLLLSHINEALDCLRTNGKSVNLEIPYEFKVILYDLEIILKATSKLKLIQRNVATYSGPCDLKKCSSLKDAEFFRVSLDNIRGFDSESNEICCITCSRCIHVFDLFASNVWQKLKILSLSYCQLNKIVSDSFSNIRNVERLILSCNNLKSIEGLDTLNNLKLLDVSFNYFEEIPFFSETCNQCLTEFYISHNNITSLKGLKQLTNLTHFDASNNCIYEKEILGELYSLKLLKWLKLHSNPISLFKHYRMYVSHFLGSTVSPYEFILDDILLQGTELDFMGTSRGVVPIISKPSRPRFSTSQSEAILNNEEIPQTKGILKSGNKKTRKGRDVIIVDAIDDPVKTPAAHTPRKTGLIIQDSVNLQPEAMSSSVKDTNYDESKPVKSDENSVISENKSEIINKNEVDQFKKNEINETVIHQSFQSEIHSSPENLLAECRTIEVTVHATQDDDTTKDISQLEETQSINSHNSANDSNVIDIDDIRILESIDLMLEKDKINQTTTNNTDSTDEFLDATSNDIDEVNNSLYISVDNINNNQSPDNISNATENENLNKTTVSKDDSSSEDSGLDDDLNGNEFLWPVQKIKNEKPVNMFLVLLDYEMREKSTVNGKTLASYPLGFVQSCTQINDDPITVEVIFSSLLKHTTVNTYIMEFADAQALMQKINEFLSSRPDIVEARLTSFLCKSCKAFFSVFKTQARTLCTVCGSALVTEMESERPMGEPLSHSSSQSSVVSTSAGGTEIKTSPNINTNPSSVSTVSSEPSEKFALNYSSTPQKYESDVEIISNPSQSSIEVLDDKGALAFKRSSEERRIISSSTLSTLVEVVNGNVSNSSEADRTLSSDDQMIYDTTLEASEAIEECDFTDHHLQDQTPLLSANQGANLHGVESNSSGSVITNSEAVSSTSNIIQDSSYISQTSETSENTGTDSLLEMNKESEQQGLIDIYSYTNFTDIDHRIKAYLYQYVFNDDSEELTLFVRCHLWKTGGTDYPGCFVLTNKRVYILMHTSMNYGLDASNWLKLKESYDLKSMKKLYPLIWNIGVGIQINQINYFILLFVKPYTDNLLLHFKGLSLKGFDIGSKVSSKVELNLQQVILTSNYVQDVIDPTILLYTVCLKINILKDDQIEEIMTLGGFVMTANEFYVVLGDLGWLSGTGSPSIHFFQMMSSLIEISQKDNIVSLHFLNEAEAVEVVWLLHCSNSSQVNSIIEAMKNPWQDVFSEPLQVSMK